MHTRFLFTEIYKARALKSYKDSDKYINAQRNLNKKQQQNKKKKKEKEKQTNSYTKTFHSKANICMYQHKAKANYV